jgi:flagellar biosynthesis protein FlhF
MSSTAGNAMNGSKTMSHSTIRTFRAGSVREALAKVRAALGPDAVVLQATEVAGNLFRKAEFEVTASLDDSLIAAPGAGVPQNSAQLSAALHQGIAPAPRPPSMTPAQQPLHESSAPRDPRAPLATARTPETAPWFAQPTQASRTSNEPAFASEPGFAPPSHPRVARDTQAASLTRAPQFTEWQDEVRDLRSALAEARSMLSSFSAQGRAGADSMLAPAASEANELLLARGVDPQLAALLIRAALAQGVAHETKAIMEGIRAPLAQRLTADRAPWARGGRHTIAFVGPTGVGKTTTLAKVAARALMEGNRRVGLITVDTYRIGASEQLARYGEIMGVPAFVAKNARELQAALERCARCDLILIDTAGRSAPDQLQRQIELVRAAPEVELHLVCSAASGARDLAAIADRYSPLRPDRLVITKVDEAAAPGALLSAATGLGVPISCVCDGQRVPEDIHAVTRTDLVDLVLGSWPHERD